MRLLFTMRTEGGAGPPAESEGPGGGKDVGGDIRRPGGGGVTPEDAGGAATGAVLATLNSEGGGVTADFSCAPANVPVSAALPLSAGAAKGAGLVSCPGTPGLFLLPPASVYVAFTRVP